jgi:hypothetical protein
MRSAIIFENKCKEKQSTPFIILLISKNRSSADLKTLEKPYYLHNSWNAIVSTLLAYYCAEGKRIKCSLSLRE